ncbi:MAG TPA: peptidoglycan bridge formation glycyltransferase FemA/FemB family protein [Candidatus Limnocylindria bacterium]|nr:peptidoglycan bridge formation glycyltransferase FemA/FemB family protein [Candidatus Limnocylindria bacterium]
MIDFRPATDADAPAWQAVLEATTSGDFLHDWAWADVAAFDGQPQRRYVIEQDGRLVGLAAAQERPLLAGRTFWYVPHGPVLDYDHPEAAARLRAMLLGLRGAARHHRAVAVKVEPRLATGEAGVALFGRLEGRSLRRTDEKLQVGQTRLVTLADDDALIAAFDKDTRYGVRRAEREGVTVDTVLDATDTAAVDALHDLVGETQRRAGFPMPPLERYRLAWRVLAGAGRAAILEARREGRLLASGLVVVEGDRSFYLFSGSRREEPGEPKRYASYALQWEMMRYARGRGVRVHDLWGVAPPDAGPEHPWHGVGLFKKGFGGREVVWAGSWDVVADPTLYRLRAVLGIARGWLRRVRP